MRWTRTDPGQPPDTIELTREGEAWVVRHGGEDARFTGPDGELLALVWRKSVMEREGWGGYAEGAGDVEL